MRADEIDLQYVIDGSAPQAMQAWRADPPGALGGFQVKDESYQSITYEHEYYDWPWKLMFVLTFGVTYLMRHFLPMGTIDRLVVRFDPEGDNRAKVTVVGKANDATRAALGRVAVERGTIVNAGGVPAGGA